MPPLAVCTNFILPVFVVYIGRTERSPSARMCECAPRNLSFRGGSLPSSAVTRHFEFRSSSLSRNRILNRDKTAQSKLSQIHKSGSCSSINARAALRNFCYATAIIVLVTRDNICTVTNWCIVTLNLIGLHNC